MHARLSFAGLDVAGSDRLTNTCARLVESPDNAKGSDDKGKIVSAPCDHRNDAVASCHSGARPARSEFLLQILPRIWSVGDCGLNASVRKRTEFGAAAGAWQTIGHPSRSRHLAATAELRRCRIAQRAKLGRWTCRSAGFSLEKEAEVRN